MALGPNSPRAHRSACALASVGTSATAASRRSTSSGVRPQAPSSPPAAATSAIRSDTSAGRSSPSQPGPKTTPTQGRARCRAAASSTASHSGLASPGSPPCASTSPPTSTSATASQPRRSAAAARPSATPAGPPCGSIRATGSPRKRAMCDSAKWKGPGPRVSGPASPAQGPSRSSSPSTSSSRRGPGWGSIGRRSQVTPPTWALRPTARAGSAVASAPTTSPPPPMPTDSTDRAAAKNGWGGALGVGRGAAPVGDAGDLLGGALELLVGEHRGALEREVARDLEERAAAAVVVADLHGHGPRDPVGAEQQHMERVVALPRQPLLGVVRRPDVEGRELLHRTAVRDGPGARDLRPRADAHAVGLMDAAVLRQRMRRRLALGPHALLEGAAELRLVGLAHQVTALVVERRVEEEALVLHLEVLVGLADTALAERDELLALGERAHGDSPFLESDWHRSVEREG